MLVLSKHKKDIATSYLRVVFKTRFLASSLMLSSRSLEWFYIERIGFHQLHSVINIVYRNGFIVTFKQRSVGFAILYKIRKAFLFNRVYAKKSNLKSAPRNSIVWQNLM